VLALTANPRNLFSSSAPGFSESFCAEERWSIFLFFSSSSSSFGIPANDFAAHRQWIPEEQLTYFSRQNKKAISRTTANGRSSH